MADTVEHEPTFEEDEQGWPTVSCSCGGLESIGLPDLETAAEVWGQHAAHVGYLKALTDLKALGEHSAHDGPRPPDGVLVLAEMEAQGLGLTNLLGMLESEVRLIALDPDRRIDVATICAALAKRVVAILASEEDQVIQDAAVILCEWISSPAGPALEVARPQKHGWLCGVADVLLTAAEMRG